MPKHIWEAAPFDAWEGDPGSTGQDSSRVIGTGPFRFVEWIQDDHVTLARNDAYYGVVSAVDEFIFRVLSDDTAVFNALEAGEIDLVDHIPGYAVEELRAIEGVTVETFDSLFAATYAYNLDPQKTTLFQDRGVRQALLYALDREAMVQSLLNGFGEVAMGIHPPLAAGYAPDRIQTRYEYDPEKATALLAQAGWTDTNGDGTVDKNGQELKFELVTLSGSPNFGQKSPPICRMRGVRWALKLEVTFIDFQALGEVFTSHEFDVMLGGEFVPPQVVLTTSSAATPMKKGAI